MSETKDNQKSNATETHTFLLFLRLVGNLNRIFLLYGIYYVKNLITGLQELKLYAHDKNVSLRILLKDIYNSNKQKDRIKLAK